MVRPHLRSRKVVKKFRKLPSSRTGVIFRKRKTSKPHCPETGQVLHGTAYGRARDVRKLSKSEKRPTRYYGGILSHRALKDRIVLKMHDFIFSEEEKKN